MTVQVLGFLHSGHRLRIMLSQIGLAWGSYVTIIQLIYIVSIALPRWSRIWMI